MILSLHWLVNLGGFSAVVKAMLVTAIVWHRSNGLDDVCLLPCGHHKSMRIHVVEGIGRRHERERTGYLNGCCNSALESAVCELRKRTKAWMAAWVRRDKCKDRAEVWVAKRNRGAAYVCEAVRA